MISCVSAKVNIIFSMVTKLLVSSIKYHLFLRRDFETVSSILFRMSMYAKSSKRSGSRVKLFVWQHRTMEFRCGGG